jgi:glutamate carboxypeptidase
MPTLCEFCDDRRDWLVRVLTELVRLESPTTDPAAVDRCGERLAEHLRRMEGTVERIAAPTSGAHLRATFGSGPPARQVMLLGHFDTVWPVGQIERMPLREADGRLYGPGVFDMKAGIVIGMLAVRALAAAGRLADVRVVMLWTADEERGSRSSRGLVEEEARRSSAVLVLEPALPGGAVKTGRKGCGEFELRVRGIPAHAGIDPTRGASAIDELAAQIRAVGALRDHAHGVTLNVGTIEGGDRPNVVAEHARAVVDARAATMEDARRLERSMQALRPELDGTRLEVSGGFSRPPFERTPEVARLYEVARTVAAEMGRELGEGTTGGGSDGNFTGALGVPTLDGLGAAGDGAHALDEHVVIADLTWRAALLAGLIARSG